MSARVAAAAAAALGVGAGLLVGCGGASQGSPAESPTGQADGCITDYQPGRDYSPHKSEVEHASNFSIRYEDTYQVLTVEEPYPGGDPQSYVLVRCGAPEPELTGELADAARIEVPVDSVFAGSTTNLPLLVELGQLDVLAGVPEAERVTSAAVRDRIEAGEVTEFAPGEQVDVEKVVAADPDVVTTSGTESPAHRKLRRAGTPVVATGDWREETPLGRAEWIKVMAALTGTEQRAAQVFDGIESRYEEVAARAAGADDATSALAGVMYDGTWFVPPARSYRSELLSDAAGTHPWDDVDQRGVLEVGFEEVLVEAGDAEVWITSVPWRTLEDGRQEDPRYAELGPFEDAQVWTHVPPGPGASSDYWERGVTRPDLVLADYVAILHPELMPDHTFEFFRRVTAS